TIIGPWATVGSAIATQTDYAVYSSDSVIAAAIGTSAETTWTNSTSAYNTTAAATFTGTRTMNAFRYSGGTATVALGAFNFETLGILNGGTGALTISGGGVVRQAGTNVANNLYVIPG